MTNVETYRPHSSLVFAGFGIVLCTFFIWSSFYQGGTTSEITSTFVALFVVVCIYIFLIRPKIIFCDEGIIITNPLEEITIGWADVIELDARWAMAIQTEKFTVSAWAATAPGRQRTKNVHFTEVKGMDVDFGDTMRVADSPRSDSGAATHRAKTRLAKFRRSDESKSLITSRVHTWNALILAAVLLITAIVFNGFGH